MPAEMAVSREADAHLPDRNGRPAAGMYHASDEPLELLSCRVMSMEVNENDDGAQLA